MFNSCVLFFIVVSFAFSSVLKGQNNAAFTKNGNNIVEASCSEVSFRGGTSFYLNTTTVNSYGSAWYHKTLDLTQPFDLGFYIIINNLTSTGFQDIIEGVSFTMQTQGTNVIGAPEAGMGFGGIQPSVSVSLDMKHNLGEYDPDYPHLAIQSNGITDHSSAQNLSAPVNISPYIKNLAPPTAPEPLIMLQVFCKILWDPTTRTLTVLFDGTPMVSITKDLVATVFNGNPIVHWGFTCSQDYFVAAPPGDPAPSIRTPFVRFYFGKITPDFISNPRLDTCYTTPVLFRDNSIYDQNDVTNSINLARWYWEFGNGITSTLQNPLPQHYPGPGAYTLRYTVTNQIGCTVDTLVRKIKLGSKPQPDFSVTGTCEGVPSLFSDKTTVATGEPTFWNWTFANATPAASTEQHPAVIFDQPGMHDVSLVVTSEMRCVSDRITRTVEIKEQPQINFSYIKDCFRNIVFNSSVINNATIDRWHWSFGDGTGSSLAAPGHFYAADDTFAVSLTAVSANGCRSDTNTQLIPVKKIIAFAGNDTIVAAGQPLWLHAKVSSSHVSWSPPDFLSSNDIPDPIATLQHDQTYYLTVINEDGCTMKDTISIVVFAGPDIYVPSAFTPNGDGKNDVLKAVIPGIRTLHEFAIFNRWGQKVFGTQNPSLGWNGQLKGKPAEPGVYVWQVQITDFRGVTRYKKGTVTLIR
ncbi:MAG: gliding motility-associated C-terminal domain-containing protein [Chitinophagaceae bacterium]|nr:gliding motility-associated C-terminal domain-containing protein [Chitinophagaceae bacterium]